jgi:hypothetical protein
MAHNFDELKKHEALESAKSPDQGKVMTAKIRSKATVKSGNYSRKHRNH